jgi:hypothetical protein
VTKKHCPLGEDCDLTIAWMKGAEDARDKAKARIEALEAKLAKAVEAKLEMAVFLLTDAMVQLREGKIKTRRNRADIIEKMLEEWRSK